MITLLLAAALAGPSPALQRSIKSRFDAELLDGPSARWKWPKQLSPTMYCGWVNGKNRMGAYTGWAPFAALIKNGKVTAARIIDDDGVVDQVFSEGCSKAGYDMTGPPTQ